MKGGKYNIREKNKVGYEGDEVIGNASFRIYLILFGGVIPNNDSIKLQKNDVT